MTQMVDVLVNLSPTASLLLRISVLLAAAWLAHAILTVCRSNARWRLLLWRGLMVGLLLGPGVHSLGHWQIRIHRSVQPRTVPAPAAESEPATGPAQAPAIAAMDSRTAPAPAAESAADLHSLKPRSLSVWAGERTEELVLACWCLGTVILLLRCGFLIARIRRTRTGSLPAGPQSQSLLDRMARELRCRERVLLRFSPRIASPFLTGMRRPVIILPERMGRSEYENDLPGILAHEVAHVRAHDLYWMLLARFVFAVLWFHPLAWRMCAAHSTACEEVCDAIAADYVGNTALYSSSLARVALDIVKPVPSVGGIPMARSSQVIGRLRLLERGVRPKPVGRGWLFLCVALGTIALGSFAGVRLVYAAAPATATSTYTVAIEGKVTDAVTGKPVPGADVRGWVCLVDFRPDRAERSAQQQVKTDGEGRYRLTLVSPLTTSGRYKGQDVAALMVRAAGYGTRPVFVKGAVTPAKLAFTGIDVALGPGRKLTGRIVDEQHQPVAGARIAVGDDQSGGWDDWSAWGGATSDEKGLFEIWMNREKPKDMGPNPRLAIIKPGYGTVVQWDILQKEDLGDVVLKPGGTVTGKVVDQKGKAVSGCTMDAFLYPFGRVGRAVTDANGNWEMKGLPGKPSIAEFFHRKNGPNGYFPSYGRLRLYARLDEQSPLTQEPDCSIAAEEGKEVAAPNVILGAQAARETAGASQGEGPKMPAVNAAKAELMGRVEDFFMHNYRDVTARKTLEWSDVTKDEQGNLTIHYKYLATIWDREKMIIEDIFTFDSKGNFVSVQKAEGYPQKYLPESVDTSTQEGLKKLVEKFFSENFRDVTSRKTIEWGQREVKENGNVSIRYMYEATIWDKDKFIMNQVFTFNSKGDYVSYENVKGYPKEPGG
jgi:beta-lactamase regulating signal transducer with metallopeptidase domain